MKKSKLIIAMFLVIINSTFVIQKSFAQCLQIESILVDACVAGGGCSSTSGPCTCEGRNEMVLFKVLGTAINTTSLTPTWPNNSFKGWKQNAQTASNVATLNTTIVKCGFLKEPVGNILPANSEVLIITSWDMCTSANSFVNLQDTLIVLFQDTNNFQGHFVNQNNGGTVSAVPSGPVLNRTLTLSYPPLACSESVTYHPHLLVNNMGTYGGSGAQNDGATVLFDALGNDTYVNNGCQAPYIPIQVSTTSPSTVCVNATANLSATISGPAVTYSWTTSGTGAISTPTGTLSGSGSSTVSPTYTPGTGESGTVTFTLTAQGKCSLAVVTNTVSVNVIALPSPTVTSSNGSTICNGNSTVLSVNNEAGVSYSWNPGAGSGTSFTVSPTSQTIYTVDATNVCATISSTFTVDVNPLPIISVTSASVCPGFTATITASGASTYTWNTGAIAGSISDSPFSTTQYTATGTDGNGCVNNSTGTIFVYNTPTVTVNSPAICIGSTVTLNAGGASTFTWSTTQNGNSISVNPGSSTNYTVVGTDANGCDNFAVSSVTVNPLPTVTVNSSTICPGNTATLTVNGASTYTWSTSSNNTSIAVSPASNTSYTVTGTDINGCVNTATASVSVVNSVTVSAVPTSTVICNGSSTTITGSGASSYTWSPASSLSSATGTSVTATPTVNTTYTVIGSSGNCLDTNVVTVNVNNLPVITGTATQSVVCAGTSITLTGSGAQTYTWTGGVTDGVPFTPSSTQTYTVNGTDINGCTNSASVLVTVNTVSVTAATANPAICSGSSTSLTGNGATNYTWSPAGSLSSSTGTSVTASPTVTTTYTVIGSSASCADTSTVTVTVNNLPTITANTSTTSVCQGGSVTLTGGGGLIYVWTGGASNGIPFTPSSTQTYTVVGVDINGCSNLAAVTVIVNPLPTVSVNSASICPGATATLTASGAVTYAWSTTANGSTITVSPGSNTSYTVTGTDANGCMNTNVSSVTVFALPTISVNSPTTCAGSNVNLNAAGGISYSWSSGQSGSTVSVPGVATSYTVTGTDANGCSNTNVATVSVLPSPIAQAIAGIPVICAGQTTTLSVTNPGSYSYTWSGPSGAAGNGTSITTGQAGVYTVTASNACGSTSATFTVAVSSPHAGFSTNSLGGQAPANVVFTNTSTGVQLQNYWNFSNGDTSHQINTAETFTTAGTYSVTLMVTDSFGCIDVTTVIILVTDQPSVVIIPNVFSPNGDNINDVFTITATGVSNFNCKIYDRWGLLLYEWFDAKGGWDGKNATDGTYYFLLNYADNKKNIITKPGYLQLVR